MEKKKRKISADYPQVHFRVRDQNEKEVLEKLIKQALSKRLKGWKRDEIKPKRNALLLEALMIGLNDVIENS